MPLGAVTWANIKAIHCCHIASLGHNELTTSCVRYLTCHYIPITVPSVKQVALLISCSLDTLIPAQIITSPMVSRVPHRKSGKDQVTTNQMQALYLQTWKLHPGYGECNIVCKSYLIDIAFEMQLSCCNEIDLDLMFLEDCNNSDLPGGIFQCNSIQNFHAKS